MGDSNKYPARSGELQHFPGAGMDALLSAIEYRGRSNTQAATGMPAMANLQNHKPGGGLLRDDAENERLRAAQLSSAALYSSALANVPNPFWGLNPMIMPSFLSPALVGQGPGLGAQPPGSLLAQPGHVGRTLPSTHGQGSPNLSDSKLDKSNSAKPADIPSFPLTYPGLPYLAQSGLNLPAEKGASVHETAAKTLKYPSALNQYLGLPGYSSLLAANARGVLPSMVSGNLNSAAIGGLGYPYYQSNLIPGLSFLPQMGQNPMIRMPLNTDFNPPPAQPQTLETSSLKPESPKPDSRPQSGGYLPMKESLQRRFSAPNPGTATQFRMPPRNDNGRPNNGGKNTNAYFPPRSHLPPQLVAPTSESNKSVRPRGPIDHKLVERHISRLISQNEKILFSPALDKVKPRRVFRRSSLDPPSSSLSSNQQHHPLTATHSAPRSFNVKYDRADEKPVLTERPNYLTVPPRLAEQGTPQNTPPGGRQYMTSIPDPRRDPNTRPFVPEVMNEPAVDKRVAMEQHTMINSSELGPKEVSYCCSECGVRFPMQEMLDAHKERCCKSLRSTPPAMVRRSVIQHTALQANDTPTAKSIIPEVRVTPPQPQTDNNEKATQEDPRTSLPFISRSEFLENPMKYVHKDIHRTHSADAAFQMDLLRQTSERQNTDSPLSDISSTSKIQPCSPPKAVAPQEMHPVATRSSIPTDKLPPKKKQLQLMRSNSSSKSNIDSTKSPGRNLSPLTSNTSPTSQGNKSDEWSSAPGSHRGNLPHLSLPLDSAPSRKTLPPWIPLDRDEKSQPTQNPAPAIYLSEASTSQSSQSASLLPSPTGVKSPSSPKSPSRRLSPGRGSRSPSRSPSNLESTVPRSNYKLLLHQLSLRNMQDMGYLSEAYHHSKDKNLKRNIASLLWSSVGSHTLDGDSASSKRMRPFQPDGPDMNELYPGKASLARRLSPNADSRYRIQETSPPAKIPLAQSRSRPYESALKVHSSVTRSHSAGYSSDVNNNIKQYLQNKSRNQQQSQSSNATTSSQPTKTHKPLVRTHANARYLLKSPTKLKASPPLDPESGLEGKAALEARNSLSKVGTSMSEASQRLKESLALKRASSYNCESTVDYQSKRQKLIPIPKQSITAPRTLLPNSLVSSRLSDHDTQVSGEKEKDKGKAANPNPTVRTPFLPHPHLSPNLGYEPHPTFCSLVSPQPMYVELQDSTLSMYSQWAVSEPLLPEGMSVLDVFKNMRLLKALSPYISYGSLFTSASSQEEFTTTDTKKYEDDKEKKKTIESQVKDEEGETRKKLSGKDEEEDASREDVADPETSTKEKKNIDKNLQSNPDWMFSQMIVSSRLQSSACYTSCHNKVSSKTFAPKPNFDLMSPTKTESPENTKKTEKKTPKLVLPKVIIHPPSPLSSTLSDSQQNAEVTSPRTNEISTLEVSECDTDDDAIEGQTEPFLNLEKISKTPDLKSSLSVDSEQMVLSEPLLCNGNEVKEGENLTLKNAEGRSDVSHQNGNHPDFEAQKRLSDMNHDSCGSEEVKGQSSTAEKDESSRKKHKKIRKSRRERNAMSPRLQKKMEDHPDSPPLEDPSLAVHPTGACRGASDDPTKICALCSMKAGRSDDAIDDITNNCDGQCKEKVDENDVENGSPVKPNSPSTLNDCPDTPTRPHTPTRVRTPTSTRPRTPVPLTVSVPKRSRDRSSGKSANQTLKPGILDKARGKGTTQHWVSTTDLQTSQASPKPAETGEDKTSESLSDNKTEKTAKNRSFPTSEYYSTMPPNKNPVLELKLQKISEASSPTATTGSGPHTLAAVVSGVMRSAAIQSKKKTKSSKYEMTELLSHSRPLIPTSELNGSRAPEKSSESEKNKEKGGQNGENSLGSLANLTAAVGPSASNNHGKHGKPSLRHLSLSTRESELFLNKANEARMPSPLNERNSEVEGDHDQLLSLNEHQDGDDGHHSDGAREDISEADCESLNPRPHKCPECKVAFRIAGHLAKHLRSKGHVIAMQKKTFNRLKQQKLSSVTGQDSCGVSQGVGISGTLLTSSGSPDQAHFQQLTNQEELLTQLGEGAETLAQAQVRALFEGNDEYAEINTGVEGGVKALPEGGASDEEGDTLGQAGSSDPRPFKCIACKVAFRFQGHLDRHFRSNMHLLAVGHFERDKTLSVESSAPNPSLGDEDDLSSDAEDSPFRNSPKTEFCPNFDHKEENSEIGFPEATQNHNEKSEFLDLQNSESDILDKKCDQDNNNIVIERRRVLGEQLRLDNAAVNQKLPNADWSNSTLVNANHVSNEPINGLVSHNLNESPKPDSLKTLSIKSQSAVIQSTAKKYEATLSEVPLPSTSPVHNRQQLTC